MHTLALLDPNASSVVAGRTRNEGNLILQQRLQIARFSRCPIIVKISLGLLTSTDAGLCAEGE
jgi:hypothetical protein